jgi:hypothetical protein
VLELNEYYDGPREGIALLAGVPHSFRSRYLDVKEYRNDFESCDIFELLPLEASKPCKPILAHATFRTAPDTSEPTEGHFRQLEVCWRVIDDLDQ